MPFAARETFGEAWSAARRRNIASLLRDPAKCAMVAVTTAEALALAETLGVEPRAARRWRSTPAAIFFNRTSPAAFDGY